MPFEESACRQWFWVDCTSQHQDVAWNPFCSRRGGSLVHLLSVRSLLPRNIALGSRCRSRGGFSMTPATAGCLLQYILLCPFAVGWIGSDGYIQEDWMLSYGLFTTIRIHGRLSLKSLTTPGLDPCSLNISWHLVLRHLVCKNWVLFFTRVFQLRKNVILAYILCIMIIYFEHEPKTSFCTYIRQNDISFHLKNPCQK